MGIIKKTYDYVSLYIRFQIYKYRLKKAKNNIYELLYNFLKIYKFTAEFKNQDDIIVMEIFIKSMENLLVIFYDLYIPAGVTKERFRNKKEVVEFLNLAFEIKRKAFSEGIWGKK